MYTHVTKGRMRNFATPKIITEPCPKSRHRGPSPYEKIDLFPGSVGFCFASREVTAVKREKWDAGCLRDYYLRFDRNDQALVVADGTLTVKDIGSDRFWLGLKVFVLADQIYVIEGETIGVFPFDPKNVIPISSKSNAREYFVLGLRECRLVTVSEAKEILTPILRRRVRR